MKHVGMEMHVYVAVHACLFVHVYICTHSYNMYIYTHTRKHMIFRMTIHVLFHTTPCTCMDSTYLHDHVLWNLKDVRISHPRYVRTKLPTHPHITHTHTHTHTHAACKVRERRRSRQGRIGVAVEMCGETHRSRSTERDDRTHTGRSPGLCFNHAHGYNYANTSQMSCTSSCTNAVTWHTYALLAHIHIHIYNLHIFFHNQLLQASGWDVDEQSENELLEKLRTRQQVRTWNAVCMHVCTVICSYTLLNDIMYQCVGQCSSARTRVNFYAYDTYENTYISIRIHYLQTHGNVAWRRCSWQCLAAYMHTRLSMCV